MYDNVTHTNSFFELELRKSMRIGIRKTIRNKREKNHEKCQDSVELKMNDYKNFYKN